MQRQGILSSLTQFLKKLLVIEAVVFSVTGIVCWYLQWWTLAGYSEGLLIAGLCIMGFGALSVVGASNNVNSNPRYHYVETVMPGSLYERTQQNRANFHDSMDFSLLTMIIGSIPLLGAFVFQFIG